MLEQRREDRFFLRDEQRMSREVEQRKTYYCTSDQVCTLRRPDIPPKCSKVKTGVECE